MSTKIMIRGTSEKRQDNPPYIMIYLIRASSSLIMLQCCNICKKLTDTLENTLNFDLFYCLNINCTVYSYIY